MNSHDLIEKYYRDIAEAAGVPVFIQNAGPPLLAAREQSQLPLQGQLEPSRQLGRIRLIPRRVEVRGVVAQLADGHPGVALLLL
jgi:hypothetical protein